MKAWKTSKLLIIIFAVGVLILPNILVFAESFSSPNFKIFDESVNVGVEDSSSQNFKIKNSAGEVAPGPTNSQNFFSKGGFLQRIEQNAQPNQNQQNQQNQGGSVILPYFLGDNTPPKIFNIEATALDEQTIRILWQTDEPTLSELAFGKTTNLESGKIKNDSPQQYFAAFIDNLEQDTIYYFKITAQDKNENTSFSEIFQLKTLKDNQAPSNVSNLSLIAQDSKLFLKWSNPKEPDFAKVIIIRKENTFPQDINDGQIVFEGKADSFLDTNLINDVTYFYLILTSDFNNNLSSGALIKGTPKQKLETKEPSFEPNQPKKTTPEVKEEKIQKIEEILPIIKLPQTTPQEQEIKPQVPSPETPPSEIGRFFSDIVDISVKFTKGIVSLSSIIKKELLKVQPKAQEVQNQPTQPETTITPKEIDLTKKLETPQDETITLLKDSSFTISISQSKFSKKIQNVVATLNNTAYLLSYNKQEDSYKATISAPDKKGTYPFEVLIIFTDGTFEKLSNKILVDPYGYVYSLIDNQELRISGATVTLYYYNEAKNAFEIWPAKDYNQINPQITDKTGEFAFFVPNGKYYLTVKKDGYNFKKTDQFLVKNNIVNINIELQKTNLINLNIFDILPLLIITFGVIILSIFIWMIRHTLI